MTEPRVDLKIGIDFEKDLSVAVNDKFKALAADVDAAFSNKAAVGAQQISAAVKETATATEQARDKLRDYSAFSGKATVGAQQMGAAVKATAAAGLRLGAMLVGSIGAAAAAFGVGMVAVANFASEIRDLADTSEGLGVGAVALAEMRSKAAEAGVEAESLDRALGKVNAQLLAAQGGDRRARGLFEALGIDVSRLANAEQAIAAFSDRLSKYGNTAERAAYLAAFFGERVGPKLAAYLTQGSEGLRQFTGITERTITESKRLQSEIDRLGASIARLKNSALGAGVPWLNDIVETFGRLDFNRIFGGLEHGGAFKFLQQLAASAGKTLESRRAIEQYAASYDELDRLMRRLPGAPPLKIPEPEKTHRAAKALREVAEASADYADSIRRAQLAESNRAGAAEIAALAAAEELRLGLLDDALRMTGELTRADQSRLDLIGEMYHAGRLTEAQLEALTADVYGLVKATEKSSDIDRELGFTFSSAFEDAIVGGKSMRDLLNGIEQDILRIVSRKLVTEPLAAFVSDSVKGFDFGALFNKVVGSFAGFGAEGLFVPPGQWGIAGEHAPEAVFGGRAGATIVPPGAGRSLSVTNYITVPSGTSSQTADQIASAIVRRLQVVEGRNLA